MRSTQRILSNQAPGAASRKKGSAKLLWRLLPKQELVEALSVPHRWRLAVAVAYDFPAASLVLQMGDGQRLQVPLAHFPTHGPRPALDLTKPRLGDFGQTLYLGEYEAAVDAIYDAHLSRQGSSFEAFAARQRPEG